MKVLMTYEQHNPHHDIPVMAWGNKYDMRRKWENITYACIPL